MSTVFTSVTVAATPAGVGVAVAPVGAPTTQHAFMIGFQ